MSRPPLNLMEAIMKAKKTGLRYSGKSAGKSASLSSRGVRERSESLAFEGRLPRKGGSTSKRRVTDPDNPPLTDEQLRRLRPVSKETVDFFNRARGRQFIDDPKQAVSLRLDRDVLEYFKDQGPGWQSRINAALRKQAKLGAKN